MKELSIEEKAKRYDEALKYAMIYYKDGNEDMKTMMKTCFPVLVEESEDERICGKLIAFLKQYKDLYGDGFKQFGLDIEDALAWLEKHSQVEEFPISQHENKTCKENDDSLTSEDERILNCIRICLTDANEQRFKDFNTSLKDCIAWLEKKCEQKEDNPPFNDPKYLAGFDTGREVQKIFDEQNPAWSEDDIKTLERIVCILDGIRYYNTVDSKQEKPYQSEIDWLNSLKKRVQPNQEWSEEDERNLQGIIDEIEANRNHAPGYNIATYDRFLSWLKSLRPQSQWKPSEEQLTQLSNASNGLYYNCETLLSLLEQLKKLKD